MLQSQQMDWYHRQILGGVFLPLPGRLVDLLDRIRRGRQSIRYQNKCMFRQRNHGMQK